MKRLLAFALAGSGALAPEAAHAGHPWRGDAYRHGIQLEVMAGPTLCLDGGPGGGHCNPAIATRSTPQVGLGGTLGWRLSPAWLVGAGVTLANRRPGVRADGGPAFTAMRNFGAYGVARWVGAIRNTDLIVEGGVGWSRQTVGIADDDQIDALSSSGVSLRPALGVHQWFVTDFGAGLRVEGMFNLHTRYCADEVCGPDVGVAPAAYRDVLFHGVIVGIELSALLFLRIAP
jgi:hypothetical protein